MTAPDQEPIDLVNALNSGRINRRDFMRRGALLGLSIPTISALLGPGPCAITPDGRLVAGAGEKTPAYRPFAFPAESATSGFGMPAPARRQSSCPGSRRPAGQNPGPRSGHRRPTSPGRFRGAWAMLQWR